MADKDIPIDFEQVTPNAWKVAKDSEAEMDRKIDEALSKAGLPSMSELRKSIDNG